ncbi:MAG: M28 family peptidase [Fidelibacterota bacterium]|nr:MAG: M28 family peptidase [Candidatus Neomarinimicrobiota bacterium]
MTGMISDKHRGTLLAGWLLLSGAIACAQQVPYFDGSQAFELLEKQVALGPRFPGSPGHSALVSMLTEYLEPRAHELKIQSTSRSHPYQDGPLPIINILARFNPTARKHVLLLAHYDTRAMADKDPDRGNRSRPILGANDGASGVAVLLVLADIFAGDAPPIGVDLLFVDAEDVGRSSDLENFSLGTKAFLPEMSSLLGGIRPEYAVLVDMVGDAELTLPVEYYSWRDARELVNRIWNLARDLGYSQFRFEMGAAIYDDHVPLLEAGIPAVDIIDFDYPNTEENYWHTLEDTPDKCSAESLEAVGTVLTTLIYSERP